MLAISSPLMAAQNDKGKSRAGEPSVSGNISGSTARAASSGGPSAHRQMLGGMALESRYTNSSGTLDEPLSATLVRLSSTLARASSGLHV